MDAHKTPDAVREALRAQHDWHYEKAKALSKQPQTADVQWRRNEHREQIDAIAFALSALDSRAGDAGEGDIETRARAIAQRVVPYEAHSSHVSARQMDRRRVAKAAARLALSATLAPAVDPASMDGAKIETYDMMHDIAVNDLGYPSILEALEATPHANSAVDAGEGIENGYTADDAVDFVFNRLASKLGLAEWQVVEGSEEWEGDVSATLHRLLVDAGIIDDDTGAVATLATPAPAVDAQEEAEHIRQTEMQEIANGAYGDGPATRGAARDYLARAVDAVPAGEVEQCSFADCPPGLFRWNGLLCFKSEYSTKAGQPDAYCVDSGEYFWGGTSGDLEKRRNLMVQPVASAALSHGEGR